jgi:hypothetical protein
MHFDPNFRDDVRDDELWTQAMVKLRLPAPGLYGQIRIVRAAAQAVPLYGQQLMLPAPVLWTKAYEGETLWMSDTPQERLMMLRSAQNMTGKVLVAGGGLGLFPQYLRFYGQTAPITVVERNADVVAMLQTTLGGEPAIQLVHSAIEQFIDDYDGAPFDACYIDIHPTIDPRWLPGLNWLRNRCATLVSGPLRIWGYHWMRRELVSGLLHYYLPPMRQGQRVDDELGRALEGLLPATWRDWPAGQLQDWLLHFAQHIAWPLAALTT